MGVSNRLWNYNLLFFNAEGKQRADVHILETKLGENTSKEDYKARIIFDDFLEINPGDSLLFSATIIPISEKRNPHQFDYKKYLINKDIHVQLRLDDLLKQSNNQTRVSWNWWQNFTSSIIAINFSKKNQPLAKALLLGHKEDLDQETKNSFFTNWIISYNGCFRITRRIHHCAYLGTFTPS